MDDLTRRTDIRILAVDDEPFTLLLLGRVLANLGFKSVTTCESGRRAIEVLDSPGAAVDLILLDLNMPEMDGIEFVRKLVERRYAGGIVLLSGEDEATLQAAETLIQAHHLRAIGHLQKPVRPVDLGALLAQWRPASASSEVAARPSYGADELRLAIERGELEAWYQPQVAVATGKVIGVETLVRWRHPEDGLVYPDQFVAVAEGNGLIDALTYAVLGEAVAQARAWREAGFELRVAVNLSMQTLNSLDFPDLVQRRVEAAGVQPRDIVLEVTESRLMMDPSAVLDVLTRLRMKRFRLSIDDFGTGHSSLAQLRDIPINELKVDRSFVHGAATNAKLGAIFAASQGLARQLGLDFVAEGVDDLADWRYLHTARCDYAQGYFIARPMPAADFPGWLADWRRRLKHLCIG
ncbi:MAG: EAL domain-containing response regulator [Steroidobacteraceae bacterium]